MVSRKTDRAAALLPLLAAILASGPAAGWGQVVINEIHYHPDVKTEPAEFVELLNSGKDAADLTGWSLAGGIQFTFPSGTTVPAGGYLVVAHDVRFLRSKYSVSAAGSYRGSLGREGGKVVLLDGTGKVEDEVEYREGFPWPIVGDPPGCSIELIHPSLENGLGGSWRASRRTGGDGAPAAGGPTPLARNSVYSAKFPPRIDAVRHEPPQPRSGEPVRVTAAVADPQGDPRVVVEYQVVEPGRYLELKDPEYASNWVAVPMAAQGAGAAGDGGARSYRAELPGSLQVHRRLVRYRIRAEGPGGLPASAPSPDDPQPNFAYFVYDGVPPYRAAINPRSSDPKKSRTVEFGPDVLRSVPAYHLIAKKASVEDATWRKRYPGQEYLWWGTLVCDGEVYDHLRYRARGGSWRYAMGKNMWKFDFTTGHDFQPRDDQGRSYRRKWTKLNLGACIQQGEYGHRGEQGMFESVGFRLFNLAGVEAPRTHWVQLRIIDGPREAPDQYQGDFWGLYLAVEQMDGRFLEEHGLPDGNLYKMEGGTGELENQGSMAATDLSDLNSFLAAYQRSRVPDDWWRKNLDLPRYYSYRSIVECIHHYDIDEAAGKNYYYFLDPDAKRWSVHPWDVDLTWADSMYGGGRSPFKHRVLERPAFRLEYQNRLREIRDLLFNDDQGYQLIDEFAAVIHDPSGKPAMVDADRARWDYATVMADPSLVLPFKAGQGRFYRASRTGDFRGMVELMKRYVDSRGAWIDSTLAPDPGIPSAPAVTYAGPPGFPAARLRFKASPYQGRDPFAAIQWRLGEVTERARGAAERREPNRYEIEAVWQSGELDAAGFEIEIPRAAAGTDRIYRVRARVKDASGRASHWSAPVQFRASG